MIFEQPPCSTKGCILSKVGLFQDLCQSSVSLMNQLSDLSTYYKEFKEKVSNFIDQQNSSEGRSSNLPKIEESHKDIVFQEWEIRIKHVEIAIYSFRDISNKIIESISDSLMQDNPISDFFEDTLPNVKLLKRTLERIIKEES